MVVSKQALVIAILIFGLSQSATAQENISANNASGVTGSFADLEGVMEPMESNVLPFESRTIGSPANLASVDSATTQLATDTSTQGSASLNPKIHVTWASANSNYRRLYFEEKLLERQGLSDGHVRSVLRSSAHFFSRAIAYPFTSKNYWPDEFQSPYAFGRPGSPLLK